MFIARTLALVFIVFVLMIAWASYRFKQKIKAESIQLLEKAQSPVLTTSITDLPLIIQQWLKNSGVMDQPPIKAVHLQQSLQLKMKPEQTTWLSGSVEQYFTIEPPAFHWNISTQMNPLLKIVGRDQFINGKGEMLIKLLSLLPVAKAKNHEKVDQASLQRYLAEIVWFPSAALSPYIEWTPLDDYSTQATMEFGGTTGSGVFHFDEQGNFKQFVALRYRDATAIEPTEWIVRATKTETHHGIKIPVECEASWELESGTWTWLKVRITEIQYDMGR